MFALQAPPLPAAAHHGRACHLHARGGTPVWQPRRPLRLALKAAEADPQPGREEAQQAQKRASAVERLHSNPAYQRLRNGSWRKSFQKSLGPRQQAGPAAGDESAPKSRQQPDEVSYSAQAQTGQLRSQQRAAVVDSTPQPGQPERQMTTVHFCLHFHAEYGQRLRIVGSHTNLGAWVLIDGPELAWSAGDNWRCEVTLPAGGVYEYKYVLLGNNGLHALAWQRGNNSVLALGRGGEGSVEVYDNWDGQPGAAVVAGGRSATRESRLLAWATDMEAAIATQRAELRCVRMELATVGEEARAARAEAAAVRGELAAAEAERQRALRRVRELETANRSLRTQVAQNTASFRHALETAHRFLVEAENETWTREVPAPLPSFYPQPPNAATAPAERLQPLSEFDGPGKSDTLASRANTLQSASPAGDSGRFSKVAPVADGGIEHLHAPAKIPSGGRALGAAAAIGASEENSMPPGAGGVGGGDVAGLHSKAEAAGKHAAASAEDSSAAAAHTSAKLSAAHSAGTRLPVSAVNGHSPLTLDCHEAQTPSSSNGATPGVSPGPTGTGAAGAEQHSRGRAPASQAGPGIGIVSAPACAPKGLQQTPVAEEEVVFTSAQLQHSFDSFDAHDQQPSGPAQP